MIDWKELFFSGIDFEKSSWARQKLAIENINNILNKVNLGIIL
ncbi:MAG: hypothetical protein WC546_04375 [Candidatus Omnitrophota bacterium]